MVLKLIAEQPVSYVAAHSHNRRMTCVRHPSLDNHDLLPPLLYVVQLLHNSPTFSRPHLAMAVNTMASLPSLNQRRLWQKERRFEEEADRLNLLIASQSLRDLSAALERTGQRRATALLQLWVFNPLKKLIDWIYNQIEHAKRSSAFRTVIMAILRFVVWLNFNKP